MKLSYICVLQVKLCGVTAALYKYIMGYHN